MKVTPEAYRKAVADVEASCGRRLRLTERRVLHAVLRGADPGKGPGVDNALRTLHEAVSQEP